MSEEANIKDKAAQPDQRQVELLVGRLRKYNEWRRGADFEQPNPTELGRDIDFAIELILRLSGL